MTWTISLPERFSEFRKTYGWVLKKNIGMMVLLTVLLFLSLPLMLLFQISRINQIDSMTEAQRATMLAQSCPSFVSSEILYFGVTLMLIFSIVFCVRLFWYLQNKRSVDLFHSLPVGRVPMLLGRWCVGMTALALPVLVNFLILRLVLLSAGVPPMAERMSLFGAMMWLLLMAAGAFTFCTFLAVCSGSMMDTVLSVLGINAGFPICLLICVQLAEITLPGINYDWFEYLAPATLLAPFPAAYLPFAQRVLDLPAWFLPWWICFTIVLLVGSCVLYRRRRSEAAEDLSAFPIPKTIVRFLVTACAGVGFGMILMNNGTVGFFIGVLAGSAVAHVIVEALYARGFSMLKKSIVWYAVFAGCFLVFYGVLTTGCFGYDTRIPDASEVESVAVCLHNEQRQFITADGKGTELYPVLKRPESIRSVLQIHKELTGWYRENSYPYTPQGPAAGADLTLEYHLKNGRTLMRSYYASERSIGEVNKGRQEVTDLLEYKQGNDVAFYLQPADMESFTIGTGQKGVQAVTITDIGQKTEMLEALKKYCMETSFEQSEDGSDYPYQVSVKWTDNINPNERLRAALGGGSGKIKILSSDYRYRSGDALDAAVQKIRSELKY